MSELLTPTIVTPESADGAYGSLADDVRKGFTGAFKELPPKHLYDERGSQLFDEICSLPEYYPTRTERAILETSALEIAARTGAIELVELGSGTAAKTRVLLDAMQAAGNLQRYIPFDIADTVVRETAEAISAEYPTVGRVRGIVGDFEHHLQLVPPPPEDAPRLVALLGGTLGNLVGPGRDALLRNIATLLRPGDYLLLGADLVKDPAIIEAAYNDSRGVTAEFNLNVLNVINRELDANFQLDNFQHVAFFDIEQEWIEMRLRAERACQVQIRTLDLEVDLAAGEEIRTEISAKFSPERIKADLAVAGLEPVDTYTDPELLYGLVLARPVVSVCVAHTVR
jgi:L-histidine Nalpha-methyltransferase